MLRNEVEVGDVRKRRGVKRKGHLLRAVERNTHDSPAAPHKPHYQPQKAGKRRRRKKKGKTKTRQTEKQHGACPVRERRTTSPTTPFGPRACAAAATATPGLHSAAGEGPPPPAAAAGGGGRGGTARRGWAGGSRRRQVSGHGTARGGSPGQGWVGRGASGGRNLGLVGEGLGSRWRLQARPRGSLPSPGSCSREPPPPRPRVPGLGFASSPAPLKLAPVGTGAG